MLSREHAQGGAAARNREAQIEEFHHHLRTSPSLSVAKLKNSKDVVFSHSIALAKDSKCLNATFSNEHCPQDVLEYLVQEFLQGGCIRLEILWIKHPGRASLLKTALPHFEEVRLMFNDSALALELLEKKALASVHLRILSLTFHPAYKPPSCFFTTLLDLLIRNNPDIQWLRLVGMGSDWQEGMDKAEFMDAMKHNTHLKTFDYTGGWSLEHQDQDMDEALETMLLHHNATIQNLYLFRWKSFLQRPNITHLMRLNQYGRRKIRSLGMTTEAFVLLLANVKGLSVLYGLLRELPGLWCGTNADQRKRSHGEMHAATLEIKHDDE